jgi:hypothetical protein
VAAKQPGDAGLDILGRGFRIVRTADGPPDHDVVSAVFKRLLDVDDPLLIIDVFDRPYARRHHQEFIA